MDETPSSSGKKQRQRNQRDRKKPQDKQSESASHSPTAGNNVSDPQPQRANRRQRNEAVTYTANNVGNSTPPATAENKETTEKENVTIDFSNLKRETEEIAKLTKKFAKRNVTSNWHRYSVPEGTEDSREAEEGAPADFSALIQVPASKGGHLQLKDEQEWSSVSGELLGGFFALNLKLLSQSLACVPIYKQLRLPKHMFTEEELKHLDNLASQASEAYNPDNIDGPSTKVLKTLTNLLERKRDIIEEPEIVEDVNYTIDSFNILDVHGSNQKLLNIELEPTKIHEVSQVVDSSNLPKRLQVSNENDKSSFITTDIEDINSVQLNNTNLDSNIMLPEITQKRVNLSNSVMENDISKTENIDLNGGKSSSSSSQAVTMKNTEHSDTLSQTSAAQKFTDGTDHFVDSTKFISEVAKETTINMNKKLPLSNNFNTEDITMNKPEDNRPESSTKIPVKKVNENKPNSKENTVQLEDDDDLDFLLSLKKPSFPEKKKNLKSVPNKGTRTSPDVSSTQQNSELDDWLDSMLQD